MVAKAYVENGGNKKEAVLNAYDVKNDNVANQVVKQVFNNPMVLDEIEKILDRKGLTKDYFTDKLQDSLELNMQGKPSQAVASDLIKFGLKLHNAIPSNKSISLNYSKKITENKGYSELKQELTRLNDLTQRLLKDTP
jgi:hypothetical protein